MNNWILVIILTMWAGIVHYLYKMNSKLNKLDNELAEYKNKDK